MRDSLRREVAEISEGVARELVFTHGSLLDGVSREVHARLPEAIRHHSQTLLPGLATAAVERATPDEAEVRARLLDGLRQAFGGEARDLVNRAAKELLPELAADAAQHAAPDPATIRAELVETITPELTEAALASVVSRGIARVYKAAIDAVERETRQLIPGLARAAVEEATPELAADGVRKAVEEAAPEAVARAVEDLRGSLTESAAQAARDVLPELARNAVDGLTPELRDLVTSHARTSAAKAVADETGTAVPAAVETAVANAIAQARNALERVQRRATTTIGDSVAEAVDKKLAEFTPNIVEVVLPAKKRVKLGFDAHQVLPELLVALHARCHVLLVGPAGTGKSMLARHAAHALEIPFQALSLGPTTPMSKMFGYYDAHGHYHDTPFRRAFEHGGVMLLDELDNGHAGLLAELNQALALGTCAFPDRMVDAHEDFRLVATGNTYGTGGDRQYVGRQTLDSATLDRFVVIDVPIDERLEERIALRHAPSHQDAARELLGRVRELRAAVQDKKLPVLFSPRASIDGAKLLEAGATVEQVLQWRIVRGLSAAHRKALGLD